MAAVLPGSAEAAASRPGGGAAAPAAGEPAGASTWLRPRWWLRLLVLVALLLLVLWPRPAWGLADVAAAGDGGQLAVASPSLSGAQLTRGAQLFEQHCAGCHVNGGNILRRGKTLKLAALERYGRADPAVIASIAAAGVGQMGGYAAVLGEGGPEAVAGWVWQQAQAGWPRG